MIVGGVTLNISREGIARRATRNGSAWCRPNNGRKTMHIAETAWQSQWRWRGVRPCPRGRKTPSRSASSPSSRLTFFSTMENAAKA